MGLTRFLIGSMSFWPTGDIKPGSCDLRLLAGVPESAPAGQGQRSLEGGLLGARDCRFPTPEVMNLHPHWFLYLNDFVFFI